MFSAVYENNIDKVRKLLENKSDINAINERGETCLMIAAGQRFNEIATLLITNGANLKMKSKDGSTALHYCANHNNIELIQQIINSGIIDINAFDGKRYTALMIAIEKRNSALTKLLLEAKIDANTLNNLGQTALIIAVKVGFIEGIQSLIQNQCNIHARDFRGWNAFLQAINSGNMETINLLIQNGAYFSSSDYKNTTPLMVAVTCKHVEIVKFLLYFYSLLPDSDTKNVPNIDGWYPIMYAVYNGDIETLNLLLHYGCNTNVQSKDTKIPLFTLAITIPDLNKSLDVCDILYKHQTNPLLCDNKGISPLMALMQTIYQLDSIPEVYQDGLIVGDSSRCHQNVLERISIIDAQQDNVLLKRVQKLILCDIDVNQEDSKQRNVVDHLIDRLKLKHEKKEKEFKALCEVLDYLVSLSPKLFETMKKYIPTIDNQNLLLELEAIASKPNSWDSIPPLPVTQKSSSKVNEETKKNKSVSQKETNIVVAKKKKKTIVSKTAEILSLPNVQSALISYISNQSEIVNVIDSI